MSQQQFVLMRVPWTDKNIERGHDTRHINSCDVMPSPYADAPERAEKALASPTRRVLFIMITRLGQCDVASGVLPMESSRRRRVVGI